MAIGQMSHQGAVKGNYTKPVTATAKRKGSCTEHAFQNLLSQGVSVSAQAGAF